MTSAHRSPRRCARLAAGSALALCLCGLLGAGRPARAAEDREPVPPVLFFPEPDRETAEWIEDLINNSFAELNKAPVARDLFVRRYGLVSVPSLVRRLETAANESQMWNATLTIGALSATRGPARELWPAIGPLVRLVKSAPEPWRRAFAALALGPFYGPASTGFPRRGRAEGTSDPRVKARAALVDGVQALVAAFSDPNVPVRVAASLAIAKTGGMDASSQTLAHWRASPPEGAPEASMAALLALGLLPGSDEGRIAPMLKDPERRIRACAALAEAARYVAIAVGGAERDPQLPVHAAQLGRLLKGAEIRANEWDGAEAVFARGAVGLVEANPKAPLWDELYTIATDPATDRRPAVAAAQALLFCPAECAIREKIADFMARDNSGHALREPVVAGFLILAGTEGTERGVHACSQFLRHLDRVPRAKGIEYDVRFYAAIGLARALEAGNVAPEARAEAINALSEAVSAGLLHGTQPGFRDVLREIIDPQKAALLANPAARLPAGSAALLEAAFDDPDALAARDAIDVVVHRLNDAFRELFGLDNLPNRVTVLPDGKRVASNEGMPLRFLLGWVEQSPYFTRLDLFPNRGRPPAPPPPPSNDPHEIDR